MGITVRRDSGPLECWANNATAHVISPTKMPRRLSRSTQRLCTGNSTHNTCGGGGGGGVGLVVRYPLVKLLKLLLMISSRDFKLQINESRQF